MQRVIGFSGRKRSGKGVLSDMMVKRFGAKKLSIASYLKGMCYDLLGVTYEDGERMKDDGTTFEITLDTTRAINLIAKAAKVDNVIISSIVKGKSLHNIREILQVIGTDVIRRFNPDWHIDNLIEDVKNFPDDTLIAVDDVRFPNELGKLNQFDTDIFYVIRPDWMDVSQHPSEISLSFHNFDYNHILINDRTIEALETEFAMKFANGFDMNLLGSAFLSDRKSTIDEYEIHSQQMYEHSNPLIREDYKLYL